MTQQARNPLSSTEVGRSVLDTDVLKRILRFAWVLAANAGVAWIMFTRLRTVGFPGLNFELWFEYLFEVVLPLAGIVFELVGWKFARRVNVGCFTASGAFWLLAAFWDRSDPFFGVLLIIGLGLLAVAGVTETIYRTTRESSPLRGEA